MKKSMLGEYITGYSVKNKKDEDIPVYSVTNDRGFCTEYFSKDVSGKDKKNYKIVPRGYFAYNPSRINVGSVDWQNCEDRAIVSPLYVVFKTNEGLDQEYLKYYLKSDIGRYYINESAVGAVRANLKLDILSKFRLPIPDIEEQRDIVSQLKLIDEMIELKEKEFTVLDTMIKARFAEMLENKKYEKVKLSNVCDFITKGSTPQSNQIYDTYKDGLVPYIKVYNLSFTGELLFKENQQYISKDVHDGTLSRSKVYPNDVLMNIVGPPLGKFSIVTAEFKEWNVNQAIAIFRAKERIIPIFLMYSLMQPCVLRPFLDMAVGVRQLNLSLEQCRGIEIMIPPIELQNQFADFVQQVDKSKTEAHKAIEKLKILQKNLLQKYFC